MAVDLAAQTLDVPNAFLAGGMAGLRVLASDGFWTAEAFSAPFPVPRKPPSVS